MTTAWSFGGEWTRDKLERVRKYLDAYVMALKNQPFKLAYIDAFAGTGYVSEEEAGETEEAGLFGLSELAGEESQGFIMGSARMALEVDPPFHKYLFIEKVGKHVNKLHELTREYPAFANRIEVLQADANEIIQKLCAAGPWISQRAVLFLDPFGMQVSWATIESIANTKAIDLWYLFPLGAVMRMLPRSGQVDDAWSARLDTVFGTHDWHDYFFQVRGTQTLFGEEEFFERTGNFDSLVRFFVDRLKTQFAGVAENPLILYNSKNVPLFLLSFASGNERGARIAVKIAQHILGKDR